MCAGRQAGSGMANGNLPPLPPLPQVRGARLLAAGVRDASSLQELYLAWTGVGDEGASHLAQVRRGLGSKQHAGDCRSAWGTQRSWVPRMIPHTTPSRPSLMPSRRWSATRVSKLWT